MNLSVKRIELACKQQRLRRFLFPCFDQISKNSCFAVNKIGAVGGVALARVLKSNQTLQELNFGRKWRGLWPRK